MCENIYVPPHVFFFTLLITLPEKKDFNWIDATLKSTTNNYNNHNNVAFWLVNVCNIKKRTNHDMRGNRDIFSGKSIHNRETISWQEHRISEYRIKI